ncbi:MAG: hypothetical protein V3W04_03255 [Gammaproteobacteria bacterium]
MQAFADFILQVTMPPNPIRNLDCSLTSRQTAGHTTYFNIPTDGQICDSCHVLNPEQDFFGTDGRASFELEAQHMKIPQLRNMYTKVGMFWNACGVFFQQR